MRNVHFTHEDVVTIADEVDSQLKEQMMRFMESSISTRVNWSSSDFTSVKLNGDRLIDQHDWYFGSTTC